MTPSEVVNLIIIPLLLAVLSSSVVASLVTAWFARRKTQAEAMEIEAKANQAEADVDMRGVELQKRILEMASTTMEQSLATMREELCQLKIENERMRKIVDTQTRDIQLLMISNRELSRIADEAREENRKLRETNAQLRQANMEFRTMAEKFQAESAEKTRQLEKALAMLETKPIGGKAGAP